MSEHSKEPWVVEEDDGLALILSSETHRFDDVVVQIGPDSGADDIDRANAHHIVACVNGCAGINPEAIPELIRSARLLVALEDAEVDDCDTRWKEARKGMRAALANARAA